MPLRKTGLICLLASATMPAQADAASFVLTDGMEFEGEVIQGTSNSIIIKSDSGSLVPLAYNKIATIGVLVDGGDLIEGQLISWKAGLYMLRAGQRIVGVQNGSVISAAGATIEPEDPAVADSGLGGAQVPPATAPAPAPAPDHSPPPASPITQPTM